MNKKKGLTKRQLAVIDDLFAGELDEQAVLDKHKISRNLYNKWLADEHFAEQFNERIARAYRQSEFIIARYAPLAAAKLVALTESDKEETARKACLDIISMHTIRDTPDDGRMTMAGRRTTSDELTVEAASRILAALAEDGGQ